MRLPKRDSHACLSGAVFHWTIQDRLDFVFGHVMTVDVRLPTARIIVIAYPHPCIVPCDREAALVVESSRSRSCGDRDTVTAAMKALGELEARVPTRFVQKYTLRARLESSGAHEAVEGRTGDAGELGDGGFGNAQIEEAPDVVLLAVES